jgi:hypothetical protein
MSEQPFIKIFSSTSDGCSINEIGKINNFKVTDKFSMGENTFGNGEVTPQQRFLLYRIIISDSDFNDQSLVFKVNEFIIKNKLNVPKISLDQVKNEIKKYILN